MRKTISKKAGPVLKNTGAVTSGIFQELAHHFMQLTPDILYIYDVKRNKFIAVNRGMAVLLGYKPDEKKICTPAFMGITHPEDLPRTAAFIEDWNQINSNLIREMEYRVIDAEDEYRWIRHKCRVIKRDDEGLAWQISGIVSDINEQKKIEEKLHESELLLMEKNRVLRELNYELAIEIREREKAEKEVKKAYAELEGRFKAAAGNA